jgi:hypothetical protein
MQVEQVIEIKKLDSDFWEAMEDGWINSNLNYFLKLTI